VLGVILDRASRFCLPPDAHSAPESDLIVAGAQNDAMGHKRTRLLEPLRLRSVADRGIEVRKWLMRRSTLSPGSRCTMMVVFRMASKERRRNKHEH
jgi:hypothetical protein